MPVHPARLLDDCERVWRACWTAKPGPESLSAELGRLDLALEALAAYRVLCERHDVAVDEVHRRWPACTVSVFAWNAPAGSSRSFAEAVARAEKAAVAMLGTEDIAADRVSDQERVAAWRSAAEGAARILGWEIRDVSAALDSAAEPSFEASSVRTWPVLPAPELRLGSEASSVHLLLGGETSEHCWRLSADGEAVEAVPPVWALPRPLRRIQATAPDGRTHEVPVVDPETVLLAFDDQGARLPLDEPLPSAVVYLLHVGELDADGTTVPGTELPVPFGWAGWTLTRASLAGVRRLRAGTAPSSAWTEVTSTGRMRWEGGAQVPWLSEPGGAPIWNVPPLLRLRQRPGQSNKERLSVEVVRARTGRVVVRFQAAPGALVDPWAAVPGPLFGAFEVVVRNNPRAGGQRLAAVLAEGVRADAPAQWRLLASGGGLVPATIELHTDPTVTVSQRRVLLGAFDAERSLTIHADGQRLPVVASLPFSELRLEKGGVPGPWSLRPVDVDAAELAADCALTVRLPEQATAVEPELLLMEGSAVLQSTPPERRVRSRRGDLRYPLMVFADTMRGCPHAELRVRLAGHEIKVGVIRTQPVAEGVGVDGAGLRLHGLRHPGVLTAAVYAGYAPWLPPLLAEVGADGRISLPSSLRSAGPLVVRLHPGNRADEVQPAFWPRLRDGATLTVRQRHGVPEQSITADREASAYLAGLGPLPSEAGALPRLWLLAARSRDLRETGVRAEVLRDCCAVLAAAPEESLVAAAEAGLRSTELAPVMVASGLSAHGAVEVAEPEEVLKVWRTAPLAALLLSSPLLPYLSGLGAYPADELYPLEQATIAEAGAFCGPSLSAVVSGGTDPAGRTGRFDATTRLLNELPPRQQEALWQSLGVVPQAVLDSESRAAAAWEAFRVRRPLSRYDSDGQFAEWVEAVGRLLREGRGEGPGTPAAAFEARSPGPLREPGESWMLVPQLSLGFALVARLAAWGDRQAAGLERQARPLWTSLAFIAPALTVVDLALAEALAAADHAGRRL
ncbi:hypothetical protein [Kitasatospora cathayae]|uniref:Uncharacterized protein n=1 Tax=Kitasatospora cathayae TaxID=3004092 RepID=A0ABY7QBA0_9ACTN|nr:hypothetical protein [Kitasatospora sp. HUAS 3-15]WBP89963.1 hypothetical protein O1G21_31715 [Kitasatospora sp. HUAS 3-15]